MMRLTRRTLLSHATCAGIAGSGTALLGIRRTRAAGRPFRFITNWYAQAEHAGFYQALAKGYYREAGLDVVLDHGGPQVNTMQLLVAGRYDMVIGSIGEALTGATRGMPTVAVATSFQDSLIGLVTHPDVTHITDLKGHTILLSTEVRAVFWNWLRDHYGFDDSQVRPYTYNLQPFILGPKTAMQAYATSEPYALQQKKIPFNLLMMSDIVCRDYGNPLVTTHTVLNTRREEVARFLKASMRGWKDWMDGDPTPGNAAIRAANPIMTLNQILWSRERFRAMALFGPPGTGYGLIEKPRCQTILDFMTETKQLPPGTTLDKACDFSFAPALSATVV